MAANIPSSHSECVNIPIYRTPNGWRLDPADYSIFLRPISSNEKWTEFTSRFNDAFFKDIELQHLYKDYDSWGECPGDCKKGTLFAILGAIFWPVTCCIPVCYVDNKTTKLREELSARKTMVLDGLIKALNNGINPKGASATKRATQIVTVTGYYLQIQIEPAARIHIQEKTIVDQHKLAGNEELKRMDYAAAVQSYSKAIDLSQSIHTPVAAHFTNRSLAYFHLNQFQQSLEDAKRSLEIDPSWVKGHYRKALAHQKLDQYQDAKKELEKCLELDPSNKEQYDKEMNSLK